MAVVSQFSRRRWFALQICKHKARILASSRRTRVAQSSSLRKCTTSLVIEARTSVHWSYHQGPTIFPYYSGVQRNTTGIRSECSSAVLEISSPACTPAVWAQIEPETNNNDRFIARRSKVPRWCKRTKRTRIECQPLLSIVSRDQVAQVFVAHNFCSC